MNSARVSFGLLLLCTAAAATGPFAQAPRALKPSTLAGLTFRTIGPANMSGRIVDIAVVESNPSTFYAASATGGLWKTTDNGTTFTPVLQHESVASLGCVTVSQSNPDVVWVGSGEATNRQSSGWGDGVYKSVDAGRTWTNMGLRDSHHVGRIVLHPTNPDVVYVSVEQGLRYNASTAYEERKAGVYRSNDKGETWRFMSDWNPRPTYSN